MTTIRRAKAEDAATVTDIYLRSRAGAGDLMAPGIHSPEEVARYVADVMVARRETYLAVDEKQDRAVGILVLAGSELDWLFVAPEAQGRGVGSNMLTFAQSQRPDGLALSVFTSNTPARQFYERRGWRAVRFTDGDNEEGAPDLRYVFGNHPEGITHQE